MIIYTPPKPATSIPVIDLAGSFASDPAARKSIAWDIHRACRETGFFYVSNHRIPQTLIDGQFAMAKRLFDLPMSEKQAIGMKNSPSACGYEPIGGQVLDSQDASSDKAPPDLKESFYIGTELPDDHPLANLRWQSFGHNQWPRIPGFREQSLALQGALRETGNRILAMLALSLDLPEDWFLPFYDSPSQTLRLLRYPPQPATAADNQLGAGAHTDWGGITLLAQDASGGLEVRNAAGDWIEATPIPGTLVINLGDLMSRWTNGLYNSNMHRVKNNKSGADRYSIPFFYGPRPTAIIEAMSTCVSADKPAKFATCTAAEHVDEMFRRSYGYSLT